MEQDSIATEIYTPSNVEYSPAIWFIVDDRKMYKPKEEVHFRGYVKIKDEDEENGWNVLTLPHLSKRLQDIEKPVSISVEIFDPLGNKIITESLKVNE